MNLLRPDGQGGEYHQPVKTGRPCWRLW